MFGVAHTAQSAGAKVRAHLPNAAHAKENTMDDAIHHVSGFFPHRADAERAQARLVAQGLSPERLHVLAASSLPPVVPPKATSDGVLKDMLVDGAIGTAVGTGIGALAELALVAANVSLFVASPLIAPLAMLGWGASLGGFIGATAGAGDKKGGFSALIDDAIASGQFVLLAETRSAQELAIARTVIETAVGDCTDVSAAEAGASLRPAADSGQP
jgi:hypothetical protein